MRLFKIPIAATPLRLKDIFRRRRRRAVTNLTRTLAKMYGEKERLFFSSGAAAFYFLLSALKSDSDKNKVILPAYTAGSLIIAIKKAGLVPVLCDISLGDFNMDIDKLNSAVDKQTLAIVAVHMFGIPQSNIKKIKKLYPDVFLIEDCCQAMGASIEGKNVGVFGDVSFFSFNKGKNIPTFNGGFLQFNDEVFKDIALEYIQKNKINLEPVSGSMLLILKMLALSVVVNKFIYAFAQKIISNYREVLPPKDILVLPFTCYQATVATSLLSRLLFFSECRYDNGYLIAKELKNVSAVFRPAVIMGVKPAFNRMPILFREIEQLKSAQVALSNAGFETSRMYNVPLHIMFPDLGYKKGDFSNAEYLAEHLLTLPCHPMVKAKEILRMTGVIRELP